MGITIGKEGTTIVEGEKGMALFQLISLKSALKLESHGIKIRRGFSALKMAKGMTGLKTNDRAKQMEAIEQLIAQLRPQVPVVDERVQEESTPSQAMN